CKMMILERKCSDGAERIHSMLETQLNAGTSGSDMWDKTVSFFTLRKAFIFHNGYTRSSREAMRLFPSPAEDVAPLC
uniref:Si:ch73-21g5.7 n=1 Tax=Amphiprion percula TaxID=161767 RepID=A0A3P8T7H2_AMPPE